MVGNLATQLREGTSKSHSMAENVSFVKSFLGGVVDKSSYRKLVANLYFVYQAIEEEMITHKENSILNPIFYPELFREKSLVQDLEFYYGTEWQQQICPSLATQVYIDRIHQIAQAQPELLVAHAYTRYLGDLSGGQILKKIAQKAMNLKGTEGTAFYNFDHIKNEKYFKQEYREKLNNLNVSNDLAQEIVSEANVAFTLNMRMFQELESNFIKVMIALFLNVFKHLRQK
uniref:Heme oxygenase n=1 Tax=Sciadococcus taiwanensis TaxID=3028030 RepID=A0A9Y1I298_9RHOD|nr:heme oxygenase [Sciadococcus taiwanensis]